MKREAAKQFQDLIVWQKAHQFVLSVYKDSKKFPKEEIYGLTSQFRRASISIVLRKDLKRKGKRIKYVL